MAPTLIRLDYDTYLLLDDLERQELIILDMKITAGGAKSMRLVAFCRFRVGQPAIPNKIMQA